MLWRGVVRFCCVVLNCVLSRPLMLWLPGGARHFVGHEGSRGG